MNRTTRTCLGILAVLAMTMLAVVRVGAQAMGKAAIQQNNQGQGNIPAVAEDDGSVPINFPPVIEVRRNAANSNGDFGIEVGNTTSFGVAYNQTVGSLGLWIRVSDPNNDACSLEAEITPSIGAGADEMNIREWDTWSNGAYEFRAVSYVKWPISSGRFTAPNTSHVATLTAKDIHGLSTTHTFTIHIGPIPNNAPTISVTTGNTPIAVTNNGNVDASYGGSMNDLALVITVDDQDAGQHVNLTTAINQTGGVGGVGSTGMLASEFSSPSAPVAYQLFPASGVFDAPSVAYRVDLTAVDNHPTEAIQTLFTFFIVVSANRLPSISVSVGGSPVSSGGTAMVPFGSTMSGINLVITANDLDGDECTVAATITSTTLQDPPNPIAPDPSAALNPAEFVINPAVAVPFSYSPGTGVFDAHYGSTHQIQLVISDGLGGTVSFNFMIVAEPQGEAAQIEVREFSSIGLLIHDNAPANGGRNFGLRDINAGPSIALTLCIVNNGNGTLNLQTPQLAGPDSSEFVLKLGWFSQTVAPGDFTFFQIAFDPSTFIPGQTNNRNTTITLNHNAWNDFVFDPGLYAVNVMGEAHDGGAIYITTPATLNAAEMGKTYSSPALTASGGIVPYTWTVVGTSTLPAGIVLTPAGALLGGAVGPVGNYTFTIRCSDNIGNYDEKVFSMVVFKGGPPSAGPSQVTGAGGGGGCVAGLPVSPTLLMFGLPALLVLRRRRKS